MAGARVYSSDEWIFERIRLGALAVHRWGDPAEGRPLNLVPSASPVLYDRRASPPQYGDQW
jgi:hypothetical protein